MIGHKQRRLAQQRLANHLSFAGAQCGPGIPNFRAAEPENLGEFPLRERAGSEDRTQSPATVSRKREYFNELPETFRDFGP
jgi:hypothetical protein